MKTLAVIHTTPVTVQTMKDLHQKIRPEVRLINLLDDSLLADVMQAGSPTPEVEQRMRSYLQNAHLAGADGVMCACSSVGEVVEKLGADSEVPFWRVDEPMAREAARLGQKIGVIATVSTTLEPTARLVQRQGNIEVQKVLVEGAYAALMAGNSDQHDLLVSQALRELLEQVDVVVLAQASMARVVATLNPPPEKPVLSSPESGLRAALEAL